MRPASAGCALIQRSRLQVKTSNHGLCRRTEPRDAHTQMQGFLDHGTVPILSFKASREKVQASLARPLQAVRAELMEIATSILDRVVLEWGCVEELVHTTRGERIEDGCREDFIDEYLKYHNVPGKLHIRWVKNLNSGGKLQEYGRRGEPTSRKLRLWISNGFAGTSFSRSMTAFADHEICTHAVRAINDHAQVWANQRSRYGLSCGRRERLSTEEGLASLNSVLCYPRHTRHLWSAAMLYYCAVKGQEMGFGKLHRHLIKYVRCPAKRYWYCVRTKGKIADLDQPGACGKGQVYLEGAVDILRVVDSIDFHLLYSGRVPLSKLGRVKNIVRPSLVTLPRFVQDQAKYKATLRQIARLNGILPDGSLAEVGTKKNGGAPLGIATKMRRTVPAGTKRIRKRAQALPKLAEALPALVDGHIDVLSKSPSDEPLHYTQGGASICVGGGAEDAGAQIVTIPATWCSAEREGASTSHHGRGGEKLRKATIFGEKPLSFVTATNRPHTSPVVDRCEYIVEPRAKRVPRRLHPLPIGVGPRPLSAEELMAHEKRVNGGSLAIENPGWVRRRFGGDAQRDGLVGTQS